MEPAGAARSRALWTYLVTPVAVVVGAAIIGGAVWYTGRDDGDTDELLRAIEDVQTQVQALQSASDLGADADAGVSTAQDIRTVFDGYAKQVGMDGTRFDACLAKQENINLLQKQVQRGASLGVNGTPTFFINNKKIVGAQPIAVFEEIIDAELKGSPTSVDSYSSGIQQLAATTPPRFEIMDAPVDVSDAVIKGPQNARVVVAEFSDFQCPFCKRWVEQTMDPLMKKYGNQVSLAFLHFPITQIHPNAGNAAVAAICASDQGKFWEMHDLLFARQDEWAKLATR